MQFFLYHQHFIYINLVTIYNNHNNNIYIYNNYITSNEKDNIKKVIKKMISISNEIKRN